MKQYQKFEIRYMNKTDRIQIRDDRFETITYIPNKTGNVLTDVEEFLSGFDLTVIGYSSDMKEFYTLFVDSNDNTFKEIK